MNQAIKDAFTRLEGWAESHDVHNNKQLTAELYPAYQEYQPGSTRDVNRHFLTHTRVDYNYVTVGEQFNEPGVLRIVILVDAHRHHNELICYCKAGNLPPMTLATLAYSSTVVDVFRDNVLELIKRSRGVLHHWTQMLSAPYAILELSNQPIFTYTEDPGIPYGQGLVQVMETNGRPKRPRLPAFGQTGLQE